MVVCKLCLNILDDYSDEFEVLGEIVREMLDVVLLNSGLGDNEKSVICKTCNENLHKSFEFKATCIDTEDCLYPYWNSSDGEEIDLRVVYSRERTTDKTFKWDKNVEVCRFCLSLTKNTTATELKTEILKYDQFFGDFMPELNLKATSKAVVCEYCHISLEKYVKFVKFCSNNESKVIEVGQKYTYQNHESKTNLARLWPSSLTSCKKEFENERVLNNLPFKNEEDIDIDENRTTYMEENAEKKLDRDDYSLPISKLGKFDDFIKIEELEIKSDMGNGRSGHKWKVKENNVGERFRELLYKQTEQIDIPVYFCSCILHWLNMAGVSEKTDPRHILISKFFSSVAGPLNNEEKNILDSYINSMFNSKIIVYKNIQLEKPRLSDSLNFGKRSAIDEEINLNSPFCNEIDSQLVRFVENSQFSFNSEMFNINSNRNSSVVSEQKRLKVSERNSTGNTESVEKDLDQSLQSDLSVEFLFENSQFCEGQKWTFSNEFAVDLTEDVKSFSKKIPVQISLELRDGDSQRAFSPEKIQQSLIERNREAKKEGDEAQKLLSQYSRILVNSEEKRAALELELKTYSDIIKKGRKETYCTLKKYKAARRKESF